MPNLFSPGGDLPIDRLAFGAMRLPQNDRKGFARDAETGRPERPILRVSNGPERTDGSIRRVRARKLRQRRWRCVTGCRGSQAT
jgi:hypothetical protein